VGQVSPPSYLQIQNTGNANLTVDLAHIVITGNFTLATPNCKSPILPGGDCLLSVSFAPKSAGNLTGKVAIPTNDPAHPQLFVSLSGTAVTSYPVPSIQSVDQPAIPTSSSVVTLRVYGANFFPLRRARPGHHRKPLMKVETVFPP